MNPGDTQAREALRALLAKYNKLTIEDRRQMNEATVVRQFIDILLRDVLGWPIEEPARYTYELHTQAGRPDITLIPERGGLIFLEAKRFGTISDLEEGKKDLLGVIRPQQMRLAGMATDRTPEEQQAINYAFVNNGTWAILTDFEHLRLFNARRDWLVLSFESPQAYLSDFDDLMQLSYPRVLQGSLDALSNQRWTAEVDTEYLQFITAQRKALAQDILSHPQANPWAFADDGVNLPLIRGVVQRYLDRMVIIRFAEDHYVIPPATLRQFYELRKTNPYTDPLDHYLDRFFRRFDQDHNSALFAEGLVDAARLSDAVLLPLVDELYRARYRSMPADIIGNTYEQYLGQTLALTDDGAIETRDNLETRKKQGSYYTPQVIVRYIVDNSLGRYLYGTADGQPAGEPLPGEIRKTAADITSLRVLDSACGSGSFLIYAYEVLAGFYERERARLEAERAALVQRMAANFADVTIDDRVYAQRLDDEINRITHYPRLILETHLYGVDLDPQAAEIAVVNLMMRGMERKSAEKRLPLILNQNVKVGNGLVGLRADSPALADHQPALAQMIRLRRQLLTTPNTDPEHDRVIAALEQATADLNAIFAPDYAPHFSDLDRAHPFHWGIEFPEVFFNDDGTPQANGGFQVIFGNPPWEIVKPDLREFYAQFDPLIESRYTRAQAETRIAELQAADPRRKAAYEAVTRHIEQTAAYYRQSSDFTRQGRGDTATHKLFLERMWALLQSGGRLGYVVPSGIYTDLGTKDLREMLLDEGSLDYLYSFSNERYFFPGVDHRFKFALLGAEKGVQRDGFWAAFRFNPRVAVAPLELPAFLADESNLVYVRRESLKKFSPDSLSVMEFQTPQDYTIAEKIYDNHPLLGDDVESWNLDFTREFDMANDSDLFQQPKEGSTEGLLPLYEGKMIHQFDAFFASARFWINEQAGINKLKSAKSENWFRGYRFAFREVSAMTNERTCIATVLPPNTFAGHTLWVGVAPQPDILLYYVAMINSFCIDWLVRFKGGTHVTLFLMKSLPVPRLTAGNPFFDALVPRAARLVCTRPEYTTLWHAVMGADTPLPPAPSPEDRQRLRDEIDALVAHLYGLTRAEFDHILGTFPLVFPPTETGQSRRAAVLTAFNTLTP